ncbi:MAG: UvrD-helicase domain-containing protein, partial [Verrucomicrobiota bacterium]|nr:UvrD-helicase domain-containing protein [Verrucomicrobiota bacterium]
MNRPADQKNRDRFASEIDRNFSVVASAGSGKTSAITERIVQIARSKYALEWLPQLVVVTFTNRAADEMQQRARQKIFESGVSMEVMAAFNRAFFGTIHSFCLKLLSNYGHYLGLPAKLDLLNDDTELWHRFVQNQTIVGASLLPEQRRLLTRLVQVRELMELGRSGRVEFYEEEMGDCPNLCVEEVLGYVAQTANTLPKIQRTQEKFREFAQLLLEGEGYVPLPECESGEQFFRPICNEALAPLRRWIACCSLKVAAEIGRAYRNFRLEKGALTYDDQVALAAELMQRPDAARRIREKNYRVILDEAQDTDPAQFDVLIEIARPNEAREKWLKAQGEHPRAGHFCMVGDFQQSIYPDRADLAHYRKIHEALVHSGAGEAVEFSVTFRLDQGQIDFVNATFKGILNDSDGQAKFIELNPRPAVLPGQVVRLEFSADGVEPGPSGRIPTYRLEQCEAEQLAAWLRETGLGHLRANAWRDVAILCPRKKWFRPLSSALRRAGFQVQIQSENAIKGDSPAYAWFAALITIMAEPRLGYEIVGVLREIYGLSDHDLALFAEGRGERFQIAEVSSARGIVSDKLNALAQTRTTLITLPLFTAVEQLVANMQLRERLRSLPEDDFDGLDDDLDALLALAATAEAEGETLAQFAETLRADFASAREVRPVDRDAIQLITSQKAKGSEWQAVIVPFLSRDIRPRARKYPRLVKTPSGELVPVFSKDGMTAELKAGVELAEQQSMERLLYVALTRARHALVLAADDKLFRTVKGECHKNCQTRWLQFDQPRSIIAASAIKAVSCETTSRWQQSERIRQAD